MSVGLLIISRSNPEQRDLIPIAPQKIFTSKWLPGCVALMLEWVPLFETGIPVDSSNVDPILGELDLLRKWMTERVDYAYEVERISRLIHELQKAKTQDDLDIFVG